jgi:hypothetical protein
MYDHLCSIRLSISVQPLTTRLLFLPNDHEVSSRLLTARSRCSCLSCSCSRRESYIHTFTLIFQLTVTSSPGLLMQKLLV